MTELDDPKRVLAELLNDEWDASNTLGVTPEIRTGWRDSDLPAPQVTVGTDEESPITPTGFSGMSGSGGGPTATIRGTVQVNTWVSREVTDENPKQLSSEVSKEIKRVVRENLNPSTHAFGISGLTAENYRYISWLGREFLPTEPSENESPVVYRYLCEIRYEYLDEP